MSGGAVSSVYCRLPLAVRGAVRSSLLLLLGKGDLQRPTTIVSYPKSGRTWLRAMVGKALELRYGLPFARPGDVLEVGLFHQLHPLCPRIIFSHADAFRKAGEGAGKGTPAAPPPGERVVLLARDPRDVVVSGWARHGALASKPGVEAVDDIDIYLHHEVYGLGSIVDFMNAWAALLAERGGDAFLLRFEDLKADPQGELRRLLDFLGAGGVPPQIVERAVEFASFENMAKMEEKNVLDSRRLQAVDSSGQRVPKVRKGKVGGYREELGTEHVDFADRTVRERLSPVFRYS